jgi:hypothetical protein
MSSEDVVFVEQYKDGNGWTVKATNTAGSGREVYAYAVCLHNVVGASTTQVQSQFMISGSNGGSVSCPAGSIRTAVGWKAQDENVQVFQSHPSSQVGSNSWYVQAKNESALAKSLKVYVVCLSGTGFTAKVPAGGGVVSVPGNSPGKKITTCPVGTAITGAGFSTSGGRDALVFHGSSGPWGANNEWRVYVTNTSGSTQTFWGRPVCLSPAP